MWHRPPHHTSPHRPPHQTQLSCQSGNCKIERRRILRCGRRTYLTCAALWLTGLLSQTASCASPEISQMWATNMLDMWGAASDHFSRLTFAEALIYRIAFPNCLFCFANPPPYQSRREGSWHLTFVKVWGFNNSSTTHQPLATCHAMINFTDGIWLL